MNIHGGETIGGVLGHSAERFPDKVAVIFGERRLTYRELDAASNRLAHALAALGAGKGAKIAVVARNGEGFVLTHFATAKSGAVLVPLNTQCTGRELSFMINDADASVLVFEEEFTGKIDSIRADLPAIRRYVSIGASPCSWALPFAALLQDGAADPPAIAVGEDDDYLIMYTSGTTGKPKGALLTHRARVHQAIQCVIDYHMDFRQVTVLPVPLFHTGGLNTCFMPHMLSGATVILMQKFDVPAMLRSVEAERATMLFMVPAIAQAIIDTPDLASYDLSSLEWFMYGGAPLPLEVFRRASERLPQVRFLQGYGSTEASQLTVLDAADHAAKAGATGKPSVLARVRVVDAGMRDVKTGEVGEIVARGPFLMKAYYKQPEATAEAFRGGWLHTGDLARVDDEGFITIVDRAKDMIISGGENIYPKEIEEVLYTHPAVQDAAVFGIPDDKWGESVCATLVLRKGASATEAEIIDFCRQQLAGYKKPRLVKFVDSLPRTGVGKIAKQVLRAPYWQNAGRNI
ncbi:MAG: long-chain-fatty-acid--CoA ligase [Betaproteobacteria bacterium]|nr:long-chain-fatty-acid--CoA ligase [Betaproteobacteria bacterium]